MTRNEKNSVSLRQGTAFTAVLSLVTVVEESRVRRGSVMDEKENWTRSQEMGFANWLCDYGQVSILSGPRISHVDTEVGGQKLHTASGSRATLSSGWHKA